LGRAGGDPQSTIQRLLEEHQATKEGASALSEGPSASPETGTLISRFSHGERCKTDIRSFWRLRVRLMQLQQR
jgi:hypothetical protein